MKRMIYYTEPVRAEEMRDTLDFYGIQVSPVVKDNTSLAYFMYPEILDALVKHIFTEHGYYN